MWRDRPADLLDLWEKGRGSNGPRRAWLLLQAAVPSLPAAEAAAMPIGARELHLLALRGRALGDRMECALACPRCEAARELALSASAIADAFSPSAAPVPLRVIAGGREIDARPLDTAALAAAAAAASAEEARALLVARCTGHDPDALSAAEIDALAKTLLAHDPAAEIVIAATCSECGASWSALLDVAEFLWHEVTAAARQALRDIDAIARIYHWSEHEILAMSAARRQTYLELARA